MLLSDARTDVNARTKGRLTPLHLAVACTTATGEQVADTVALLLKHPGVDATATSAAGDTAKAIARRCHRNIVDLFDHVKEE